MDPLAIGFATTGATLLVTVTLFIVDRVSLRLSERRERERRLMSRVLDTLELSARSLARPVIAKAWTNPDLEYALLTPRLILELEKHDRVIAHWVQRQAQRMQLAHSKRATLEIQTSLTDQLLRWHHGELPRSWFLDELRNDPYVPGLRAPQRVAIKRATNDTWGWAQLLLVLAAIGFMLRQVFTATPSPAKK